MKVVPVIINSLSIFLLNGRVFSRLKSIVITQQDTGKSNAEKHAAAKQAFKDTGLDIANWALDLGIKMAVDWMKKQVD
jgi:hypothetical protein